MLSAQYPKTNRKSSRCGPFKALVNEDTLLPTHCCRHKCFPVCPRAQHLLRTQILCPGHKKCFWFCSETFCVRNKCFPVCAAWKHNIHFVSRAFARPRNIMSNNVSATMCPRLPGPLKHFATATKARTRLPAVFGMDHTLGRALH